MNKLKCKIIRATPNFYSYIVIDKDYNIVANGMSSNEGWVQNDAGGYHTKENFDKLYGENNWEVDFLDMYSDESDKITGKIKPNLIIEMSN